MKEDLDKLFNFDSERKKRRLAAKANFKRPAYSYTSICPDEKYRIVKAATAKLPTK